MNPSLVANYAFNLAKIFNSFYAEHSVAMLNLKIKNNYV